MVDFCLAVEVIGLLKEDKIALLPLIMLLDEKVWFVQHHTHDSDNRYYENKDEPNQAYQGSIKRTMEGRQQIGRQDHFCS